jgi:hypothetical protein
MENVKMKIKFMTKLISAVCAAAMATACVAMPVGAVRTAAEIRNEIEECKVQLKIEQNNLADAEKSEDQERIDEYSLEVGILYSKLDSLYGELAKLNNGNQDNNNNNDNKNFEQEITKDIEELKRRKESILGYAINYNYTEKVVKVINEYKQLKKDAEQVRENIKNAENLGLDIKEYDDKIESFISDINPYIFHHEEYLKKEIERNNKKNNIINNNNNNDNKNEFNLLDSNIIDNNNNNNDNKNINNNNNNINNNNDNDGEYKEDDAAFFDFENEFNLLDSNIINNNNNIINNNINNNNNIINNNNNINNNVIKNDENDADFKNADVDKLRNDVVKEMYTFANLLMGHIQSAPEDKAIAAVGFRERVEDFKKYLIDKKQTITGLLQNPKFENDKYRLEQLKANIAEAETICDEVMNDINSNNIEYAVHLYAVWVEIKNPLSEEQKKERQIKQQEKEQKEKKLQEQLQEQLRRVTEYKILVYNVRDAAKLSHINGDVKSLGREIYKLLNHQITKKFVINEEDLKTFTDLADELETKVFSFLDKYAK